MPICKRCGLPNRISTPIITGLSHLQLQQTFNPDYCAWCNAVVIGRLKIERSQYASTPPADAKRKVADGVCPECGSTLFFGEGCHHCPSCGYEKC